MGKEITLFKAEEKKSLPEVSEFLRQLADKLDKNKVTFRRDDKKIKLNIPDRVELEVHVEKEIGKRKTEIELEIEIKWVEGDTRGAKKSKGPLIIV